VRMRGFHKQYWISWKPLISWLHTLDLDNFRFIKVDFVAEGRLLLLIYIGFREFWWISWISIFRPTTNYLQLTKEMNPSRRSWWVGDCLFSSWWQSL